MAPYTYSAGTQAVFEAFITDWRDENLQQDLDRLAAALRALVDQVVPDDPGTDAQWNVDQIEHKILTIATELENANG